MDPEFTTVQGASDGGVYKARKNSEQPRNRHYSTWCERRKHIQSEHANLRTANKDNRRASEELLLFVFFRVEEQVEGLLDFEHLRRLVVLYEIRMDFAQGVQYSLEMSVRRGPADYLGKALVRSDQNMINSSTGSPHGQA